jgi:hypothetical protein
MWSAAKMLLSAENVSVADQRLRRNLGSVALFVKTMVDLVLLSRVVRSLLGQRWDVRSIFCICGRRRTSRARCVLVAS